MEDQAMVSGRLTLTLPDLPDEVLLLVLSFLSIPDLLQLSRTCHHLYHLVADPILHQQRLRSAITNLQYELSHRRTKASISPPNAWIWLNRTNILTRSISRSLIKIRLCHSLERRPSTEDLIQRAILPVTAKNVSPMLVQLWRAMERSRLKDGLCKKLERRPSMTSLVSLNILPEECVTHSVSPGLVAARRRVIKESLKDGLRAWVETRALKAQERRALELDDTERKTVKTLVRRLAARKLAEELDAQADSVAMEKKRALARWGRALEVQRVKEQRRISVHGGAGCAHPTRAHVSGLKRFWESVIRTAST